MATAARSTQSGQFPDSLCDLCVSVAHSPREIISKRSLTMSAVRVLVGTKKGAFILTSDGARKKWEVTGPHFAGWEIYHLKGSPVDPNRIYVSQSSGWFGQIIQRSNDGGKNWEQPRLKPGEATTTPEGRPQTQRNNVLHDRDPRPPHWEDGHPQPWGVYG